MKFHLFKQATFSILCGALLLSLAACVNRENPMDALSDKERSMVEMTARMSVVDKMPYYDESWGALGYDVDAMNKALEYYLKENPSLGNGLNIGN